VKDTDSSRRNKLLSDLDLPG